MRQTIRLIREPTIQQIEQFGHLILIENQQQQQLNDHRISSLSRANRLPWCHFLLASASDAPGLIIGGLFYAHLPQSNLCYVALLFVRKDFRSQGCGSTLFREFINNIDDDRWIIFCDLLRVPHLPRVRHTLLSIAGRYSIQRIVGYAENLIIAASELIRIRDRITDEDPLPEVCAFPNSLEMSRIAAFDAQVVGRNRLTALQELSHMDGYRGFAAIDSIGSVMGYGISVSDNDHRIRIGPLYATNLITAICLLRDLCMQMSNYQVTLYVPDYAKRMLRFMQDKAMFDMDAQFERLYSREIGVPLEDTSRIFAISAQLILPDC